MSIGSLGMIGSLASVGLPQRASEASKAEQETTDATRAAAAAEKAENAAGIGQTEGDAEASDRDADGRRLWETQAAKKAENLPADDTAPQLGKDPTGEAGSTLDLVG